MQPRPPQQRLLPREHGAYGQLALPLVTAHVMGSPSLPAWCFTASAAAAFIAHEPLLVLLGRRGPRALRGVGPRARVWLAGAAAAAIASGVLGIATSSPMSWGALWLPAPLVLVSALLLVMDRERSALGEGLVGLTLPSLSVPVAVAAGVPLEHAVSAWGVWSLVSVSGTFGVRAVIGHHKSPRPLALRVAGPSAALGATGLALAVGFFTIAEAVAAILPIGIALGLAAAPPHPRRLRQVGWVLLVASLTTAALLGWSAADRPGRSWVQATHLDA